jgi:superfamily II DNA/RNA helicase
LTFSDFNLDPDVLDGIHSMGYKTPTPIQEQAIPLILANSDLIACAQTGTGKTAAFVLPLLHKILQLPADGINTLILVPTRELAIQIDQQIDAMSYFIDVKSIAVYGGGSGDNWNRQKKALISGADIIIATPGRLIAQMQMGGFDFSKLRHLVLDEADRMLDMGFSDDILRIVGALPKDRQTLCFSATMPPKIRSLANKILDQPAQVSIAIAQPASGIRQLAYCAHDEQKLNLALDILKNKSYNSVIIFSSSKDKVRKLEARLRHAKISARAFHSDLVQEEREALMQDFKNRKVNVLVGTDILSRGIDVEGIDLVLNFDVPHDAEDYVHRIGRTARAETTGTAITFINEKDQRKFAAIEKMIATEIEKLPLPDGYGPAPVYRPESRRSHPGNAGNRKGKGQWKGKKKKPQQKNKI